LEAKFFNWQREIMERSAIAYPGFPRQHSGPAMRAAAAATVVALHLALLLALMLAHTTSRRALHNGSEMFVTLAPSRPAPAATAAPLPRTQRRSRTLERPIPPPISPSAVGKNVEAPTPPETGAPFADDAFTIGGSTSALAKSADFREVLLGHISNFRQYPAAGVGQRLGGTAYIAFTINRAGTLLAASLQRSSGNEILDGEALATIRRSQPFPNVPDDLPDPLTVTLPIAFVPPPK
jgi:TonB family protein